VLVYVWVSRTLAAALFTNSAPSGAVQVMIPAYFFTRQAYSMLILAENHQELARSNHLFGLVWPAGIPLGRGEHVSALPSVKIQQNSRDCCSLLLCLAARRRLTG